jgi:hypothetical protein
MGFFMGMFVGGSVTLLHAGMSGGLKVSADATHFALTGSSSSARCLFTLAHCFCSCLSSFSFTRCRASTAWRSSGEHGNDPAAACLPLLALAATLAHSGLLLLSVQRCRRWHCIRRHLRCRLARASVSAGMRSHSQLAFPSLSFTSHAVATNFQTPISE